jgi:hypothetical protein
MRGGVPLEGARDDQQVALLGSDLVAPLLVDPNDLSPPASAGRSAWTECLPARSCGGRGGGSYRATASDLVEFMDIHGGRLPENGGFGFLLLRDCFALLNPLRSRSDDADGCHGE